VFDVDLVGQTICVSPALLRLASVRSANDTMPLSEWMAHMPPELVADSRDFLRQQLRQGATAYEREITLPQREGEGPSQLLLRVHVVWRGNRAVRLRGACVDLTERHQVNAQLQATRGQLSQQLDDLNQLHELSTQLLETTELKPQLHMILATLAHFH